MKVLLIGHSRIARRRVLPALRSLPAIQALAVASRTARKDDIEANVELYRDYQSALAGSRADLAYISLANSDHAAWARRCLEAGLHVVVDKPACLSAAEAKELADLSAAKRRCLAEATVFSFHPQFDAITQALREARARPTRVSAVFSFPPLLPSDFRYRPELGGGALNDLGPYVAAASRLTFGAPPATVTCHVMNRTPEGLETAFSVLLTYPTGGAFAGHFGFDTEYQNRILVVGPGIAVETQRVFTLPPDVPGRIVIRANNVERQVEVPASDAFQNFLREVVEAIATGNWERFPRALVVDAEFLAGLRRASRGQ